MKKMNKYIYKDISILGLDDNIACLLTKNEIRTVNDLWLKTKKDLKNYGLKDKDIKLEMNLVDLNDLFSCFSEQESENDDSENDSESEDENNEI